MNPELGTDRPKPAGVSRRRIGAVSLVVCSVLALPIGLVMMLALSNACGMFADGCDEYGQVADGFWLAVVFFVASVFSLVSGAAILWIDRRRES